LAIVKGCGPVALCGKGLIVARHNIHGHIALCGKGLIIVPSPVAILGKGFVVILFGKRLVVALFGKHGLFCVLSILFLSNVHTVFSVLALLAFGNIHAFGNVHAISSVLALLNLSVFAPLVIAWRNMVLVASCKQQHEHFIVALESFLSFPCICCFIAIAPCNITIKENCCIDDVVVVVSQSILALAHCAFAIVYVVDPHLSKRLVVTCACTLSCCDQPLSLLPAIQQEKIYCHPCILQYNVGC
jgi:hypothetical protein